MHKQSYEVKTIADKLMDFVCNFPSLDDGEKKLLVDSLIDRVEIEKNKRVTLTHQVTLCLRVLSPSLAPRGEKPKVAEMRIYLGYDLQPYYGMDSPSATIVGLSLSRKSYAL